MAYLAQPVIVGSPNVVVVGDGHTSTMNLAGNIVRSSHYIPDPSSGPATTDPHSLHPTLKSLPYPLTLPPVMNATATSGADLANFEEDEEEDADTEDSRSLLSAVTVDSFGGTDNNSSIFIPSGTSYNAAGSFRENVMPSSFRGQSSLAAHVRSQSRSPVAYHRIPVGDACPIIPTVPGAAVVGSNHNNGLPSVLVDRVPGTRVVAVLQDAAMQTPSTRERGNSVEAVVEVALPLEEPRCNVCHLDFPATSPVSQSPLSPMSPSRSTTNIITSTCSNAHTYHVTCFQTALLQPAIMRTMLPACPAPCQQHIPARCFLHAVSSEMKRRYLQTEMEIMMMKNGDDNYSGF